MLNAEIQQSFREASYFLFQQTFQRLQRKTIVTSDEMGQNGDQIFLVTMDTIKAVTRMMSHNCIFRLFLFDAEGVFEAFLYIFCKWRDGS